MHHEKYPSEEMKALLREADNQKAEQLRAAVTNVEMPADAPAAGPTGRFPGGKLTENDEGELALQVGILKGKVVLNFGSPVASFGMEPKMCLQLAMMLRNKANQVLHEQHLVEAAQKRALKSKR